MPPIESLDVIFPTAGELRHPSFQATPPYTSTKLVNVWPRDVFEGRMRGGSRPGLRKAFAEHLPQPVHLLANLRVVESTGLTGFEDQFTRDELASWWTAPPWLAGQPLVEPSGIGYAWAWNVEPFHDLGAILNNLSIDTTESYTVSMGILNNIITGSGEYHDFDGFLPSGAYDLYLRVIDTNINPQDSGVIVRHVCDRTTGQSDLFLIANGTLVSYRERVHQAAGVEPAWGNLIVIKATVYADDTVDVWFNDYQAMSGKSIGAAVGSGQRIGFRIDGTHYTRNPPPDPHTSILEKRRVDFIKVSYTTDVAPFQLDRNVVVAVGGANASTTHSGEVDLRFEDSPGTLSVPATQGTGADTEINNPNSRHLVGAELLGNLYIVGEDAEEIWQLSPLGTGALYSLTTSPLGSVSGTVPSNCSTICAWRNRLCVVSRSDPQNCSMCRVSDPYDWSFASLPVGSAIKLDTTGIDAGKLGEPIHALIPHSDDYLIFGLLNSLFVMRGDPTLGGKIDRLSSEIGIVSAQAFGRGPNGETVMLSHDGLYALPPGVLAYPESVSRERLPDELRDIDVLNYRVLMSYDRRNRGFFIALTPMLSGGGQYYWFDWETRGFQRMDFDTAHEPTAMVFRNADLPSDQRLLLGCRDGYIRTLERSAPDDDGVPLLSEALIGPIALGKGGAFDGMLLEIIGQTGQGSADVTCEVQTGRSVEDAYRANPITAGTLLAGKNRTFRPRIRGNACFIRLTSSGPWSYEMLSLSRQKLGKQRLP